MLEVHPADPDLLLVMADMSISQNEYEKARSLYMQVLAQKGLHPEVRVRIGVTLFTLMDRDTSFYGLAKDVFVRLRSDQPNDWRPHWYLGALAINREPDSIAAQSFAEVTRLEPRNGDAWWYLGSIYFDNGDYERVFETMYRARQVLPNDFRVYLLLGLAHTRTGEEADAVNELYKAYKLNPKDINVLSTLALSLDGLKRHEESDRLYEEAILVDSTNALILNNYSYSLSERGLQLERALRMATKAVSAEPQNSSYLDTIGWIHFMLGNFEPAREYIEKAIAAGEASAVVVEHLGDVYGKLGRADDARVQWEKALALDPTKSSLREKLGLPAQ
jgi:Flp pilus assembly protein TadD